MRVAMPAPEGLLNSLTGHPTALDQTLGCMTGLFHVFEGHPAFMGRRYSSTRIGIHSGEAQLRTQPESQPHRHDSPNNLFSKVDDTHKKAVQSTKQHHRCHSDLAVNPSRTVPEFRTLKDGNGSGQVEPTSADSEGTVDALAFYENESLRAAALFAGDSRRRSDLDQRENSKRNEGLPKARLADNDVSSADIRDAILASFQRKIEHSKSTKANSEQSLTSSCNQGSLRTRRDGAVSRKSMDLPRSSSPYEPAELVNWKDGLRSSTSPPRKLSHHNSPERRVEPKKDRGRSLSKDHYPFASLSPKRFPGTSQGPSPQDRRHGEILNQDSNFKESPGASDFRESLRPFLISAQERQNVPAQGSFASRSGVSSESNLVGVSHQRFNSEAESNQHPVVPNVIARLMGLEEIPASNQQGIPSSRVPDAKPRGDKFFRGLVQFDPQITRPTSPSPPPPCHSKKYVVHHLEQPSAYFKNEYRMGAYEDHYPAQYRLEQELCSSEEDRDYEYLNSVSFLPFEDEHQEGAHPMSRQLAESRKLADPTTQAEDINIVAPEKKKKMIRKILEAMRPKVFSRRKQTEQEKSPVIKLITNDVQPVLQELDLETQQQTTLVKVVTGLRLPSETEYEEPSRYTTSDTSSVKQVQEGQTDSSCESSVVKTFILQPDEEKIVVMKPNTRSEDSQAGLSQVRHVEAASSTSTDKEVVPTRRTSPTNNEDWNLNAKDQRLAMKPVKPRVPADNPPRSARAKSSLESDYESDPSSTTQNDKSNDVPESRKIRTTARQRNPSSKSPSPQIQRRNGRCSSPEARPPTRSSPSKDHYKTGEVGRRSVAAKAKKDSRVTPTNPKAQLAKEETLKKRVTENPDDSRLRKSSLKSKPILTNTEKPAAKEKFSVRSTGARARSPAAPRKVHISRSSTTDAVTRDKSDGSNSALLQPAAPALPQTSGSEPVLVTVQPEPGRSKNPPVHTRHTPTEVQITPEDSVGDHCEISSEPEKLEAYSLTPDEAQPLLQMPLLLQAQEATMEVSEELTTPQGIPSVHCEILDSKLDEGLDRPSPISVLDANAFDEELSPSPSSPRHSFPVLQDSETTYNDEGYEGCDKDLEAYNETPSALKEGDLDLDVLFSKGAEGQRAQVESTSDTKYSLNKSQSFFKDAGIDGERALEKSFLLAPKVATSCRFHDSNETSSCVCDKFKTEPSGGELTDTENIINENLLESLQSNGILQENNHMLLLDCLEEIMERILESQSDLMLWAGLPPATLCERSKGKQLEQELWIELRDIQRTASSEDICETVHRLLQRDLIRCQGRQWSTFTKDREQIGIDMETMIVEDLIEEAVQDLCALQWYKRSPPGDSSLQTNS